MNLPRTPAARCLRAGLLSSLALLALAPLASRAMDIAHASIPSLVKDNKISIGSHAFKLPPGQWMLVQGQTFTTASASNRDAEIFRGVVVLLDKNQFRVAIDVSLPVQDSPQMTPWGDDACRANSGALHATPMSKFNGDQCLAIFGHPDLLRSLRRNNPQVAQWMLDQHVVGLGSAVEIVYTSRQDATFGRMHVFFTAPYFDSDEAMTKWSVALEDSVKREFASKSFTAAVLPALPVLPASIQANDAASDLVRPGAHVEAAAAAAREEWMTCLRNQAVRLDDRRTPANEVGAALYFNCREQELKGVTANIPPARLQVMSSSEINELFENAHRQVVDSGVATNVVLEHRASRAPDRAASPADKPAKPVKR
ncbi:MAG: hypothetical protein ACJ8IK_24490 [Burkholderiaceae bacterium]